MTPTELPVAVLSALFESVAITDSVKGEIVARFDEFTVGASRGALTSVANYAQTHESALTFAQVHRLAMEEVPARTVLSLLQPHLAGLELADLASTLAALGGEYAKMTERNGKRPTIDDTPDDQALVDRLRDFDLIANAPVDGGKITVRMRPRRR
jgi:hypothetical protein